MPYTSNHASLQSACWCFSPTSQYTAGEKIKLGFDYNNFARDIIKNSKVKLFLINDQYDLAKFIKRNIFGKKIVIGMGAGTISAWMRQLPKLL